VTVFGVIETRGDIAAVKAKPGAFFVYIDVDLPFLLPLEDKAYWMRLGDERIGFYHRMKKRGDEEFSTLDTDRLPYFSFLRIQTTAFTDGLVPSEFDSEGESGTMRSTVLILRVLKKLEGFLSTTAGIRLLNPIPTLSYRVTYFTKGEHNKPVAFSLYPFGGTIQVRGPQDQLKIDNEALREFLNASLQADQFARAEILPQVKDKPFREKVFLTIHDFGFYCRQHPVALSRLTEEQLRDLLLVVFKVVFQNAEGEAFHSRGKLDFKVTNPDNKYEFVTGELKWWRGAASAHEVYEQAVRTHASGQESGVFCFMISDRKDPTKVHAEIVDAFRDEPESVSGSLTNRVLPPGSREFWRQLLVEIRGSQIPLTFGIADLYYPGR
jgi:hypothetical protein